VTEILLAARAGPPWGFLGTPAGLTLLVIALVALTAAGVFALLAWLRPALAIRVLFGPARLLYRIRVLGREHIPARGAALLVCNHVSYIDALLILFAQPRPVRFVIWAPYTRVPGMRWLLRLARVIPIDGTAGPRAIVRSLRAASDALAQGELVCIFAEGGITRTGFLLPFHRGFEQIVKRTPAPIVPVCLDHVWGSIFSYQGGRFLWKWPQKLPYPVSVAFGAPMPPTSNAGAVRQAIQKLSADCALARRDERLPVHREFLRRAARHPFRTCLIDPNQNGKVYRYAEVLAGAWVFAGLLRPRLGDDRLVGVWLPPSTGGVFANIALALLGKTSANLNYTSSPEVVRLCLQQATDAGYPIRRLLTSRLFCDKVPFDADPNLELIYLEDVRKDVTTARRLRAFLAVVLLPAWFLERFVYGLHGHRPGDLATVIFSSGSTGVPKGVMLTHGNLSANAESIIQAIDPGPRDRILGILPFFHSFGYTVTLWVPLQVGASFVFYPDPRQAKEIGDLCRTYRCTIFLSTPTLLRFCLRRCEPDDFRSLRILMIGAEKLPQGLAEEFQQKFGVLPLEGYGCTELSPAAVVNVPDWENDGVRQIGSKPGTIGQPLPGVAARIADPDTLAPLPVGQPGMLLVYGGNVMAGYLGKPEATREVIRDGWYVTGDIAKYDADGFITITDRLSRFSKIGGEMVPHQRIEDELHQILGTAERVCVVTAVPDEKKGERLIVLHVPLNGTDVRQVWKRLTERGLPNLWLPGERDFVQVPDLPVLGSGKVDLKRCKEIALQHAKT
jgi:acyl-[acyl-carrier-protein]-phospholipid O-acyltransferase / long-chain-fatty-acid--[acyl-carrier-protein] ligase